MAWPSDLQSPAAIVLTFALLAFGTWLTAFLSFRSKVRQQVWQKAFDTKWETIRRFDADLLHFADLVQLLHNVRITRDLPTAKERFIVAWGLFSHFTKERKFEPGSTAEVVAGLFPDPLEIGKVPAQDDLRAEHILTGFRNVVLQELWTSYRQLKGSFVSLLMVGYDPNVPKRMEMLAMDTMNRLSGTKQEYPEFDFTAFFESWSLHGSYVRLRLREDLIESSKSLSKALRVSPRWRRNVERRYFEKFPTLK